MTSFWLAAAVLLVLLHEWMAVRQFPNRLGHLSRFAVLSLAVVSAAAFGGSARLPERVSTWSELWRERPPVHLSFDASGDPLGAHALAGQSPVRAFPREASREEVEGWQRYVIRELRTRVQIDKLPERHVPIEVVRSELAGDVRRTLVRFTTWDGTRIPAYVHEPAGSGSGLGGVLIVPGHGAGIRATSGILDDYQHAAALALARHGYVTITAELRGFGMLTPDGVARHRAVAAAALEGGSFYKALVVRDLVLALTVLQQWQRVDPARLAVAGASLGGEIAVMLAAVDPRVRLIISQSYGGSIGPTLLVEDATDEAGQTPHGCHLIPGINQVLWREDWFRLLAPRPVLFVRGSGNVPDGVSEFERAVRASFRSFEAESRFRFAIADGGHEFFIAPAVDFLVEWF